MEWHKFPYVEISPVDLGDAFPGVSGAMRPLLKVALQHDECEERCDALVDSGSDYCVFPMDLHKRLGLSLEEAKCVRGVTGYGSTEAPSEVFFWRVTMRFDSVNSSHAITTLVGFSEHQQTLGFGVLGQLGFFSELMQVTFYYENGGFAFATGGS